MKVPGFEDEDCLVTAEFFQIHNDVFDILNSRSNRAPGYKRALSENNFAQAQAVFTKVRLMCDIIQRHYQDKDGKTVIQRILESPRRTGFLGILTCLDALERIFTYMEAGLIDLKYLRVYKLCQVKKLSALAFVNVNDSLAFLCQCQ